MTDKELTARTRILKVEIDSDEREADSDDGLIVTFSDGTTAGYVVEELLSLRPDRELTHEPVEHKTPQNHTRPKRWAVATETVRLSEVSKNGSGRVH